VDIPSDLPILPSFLDDDTNDSFGDLPAPMPSEKVVYGIYTPNLHTFMTWCSAMDADRVAAVLVATGAWTVTEKASKRFKNCRVLKNVVTNVSIKLFRDGRLTMTGSILDDDAIRVAETVRAAVAGLMPDTTVTVGNMRSLLRNGKIDFRRMIDLDALRTYFNNASIPVKQTRVAHVVRITAPKGTSVAFFRTGMVCLQGSATEEQLCDARVYVDKIMSLSNAMKGLRPVTPTRQPRCKQGRPSVACPTKKRTRRVSAVASAAVAASPSPSPLAPAVTTSAMTSASTSAPAPAFASTPAPAPASVAASVAAAAGGGYSYADLVALLRLVPGGPLILEANTRNESVLV
jgi:hypothetical protein